MRFPRASLAAESTRTRFSSLSQRDILSRCPYVNRLISAALYTASFDTCSARHSPVQLGPLLVRAPFKPHNLSLARCTRRRRPHLASSRPPCIGTPCRLRLALRHLRLRRPSRCAALSFRDGCHHDDNFSPDWPLPSTAAEPVSVDRKGRVHQRTVDCRRQ